MIDRSQIDRPKSSAIEENIGNGKVNWYLNLEFTFNLEFGFDCNLEKLLEFPFLNFAELQIKSVQGNQPTIEEEEAKKHDTLTELTIAVEGAMQQELTTQPQVSENTKMAQHLSD